MNRKYSDRSKLFSSIFSLFLRYFLFRVQNIPYITVKGKGLSDLFESQGDIARFFFLHSPIGVSQYCRDVHFDLAANTILSDNIVKIDSNQICLSLSLFVRNGLSYL